MNKIFNFNLLKLSRSKSVRTSIIFTSGNFVVAIIGAISVLLYGMWIEPEVLGEFNKYTILTGYLGFGIIFVDAAFQRHFPYYLGKGDTTKAKDLASIAKWWYLMVVWAGAIIFSILAIKAAINSNINAVLGWLVQIPAYAVATYGLYLRILYRSNDDFVKLNKNMLITTGAGLITLPLVYFLKYSGLATRYFVQNCVNTITHIKYAPYKIKAKFDQHGLLELAKVSLPLQIPVYIDSHLLKATISLIILKTLGEKELGVYVMALLLQGFLMVFSGSLNQIITTKLMLKYGSNDSLKKTFKYIIKPTLLVTGLALIIVLVFNFSIQPLITNFLPKYIASVIVVQILAFEMVFALIRSPFTLFISSLMYKEMVVIRVLKVVFTFILLAFFHDTLVHIASIIILASFLNVIAGYILLLSKIKQSIN